MYSKKMGISVYIGKRPLQEDLAYMDLAKKYGFSRIFSCFLHMNEDKSKFLVDFKTFMAHAKKLEFEVFLDVNPTLLKILNVDFNNLSLFEDLGVSGIRLDEGYSGVEESLISYSGNLKVEINASNGTKVFDNIMSYQPCKPNLVACHNFYPRRYTGLSWEHFLKCSADVKKHGIRLAGFVCSRAENTFFSQDIMESLPTIENHRYIPFINQVKEMYYCGLIDDVIISNAYATEDELKQMSELNKDLITLDIKLEQGLDALAIDMLENNQHMNRGDASEYVIRSTQLRIKYKAENIEPFNTIAIEKGHITVDNNNYGKYKGELQVARKQMENSGSVNVIAKILDADLPLLNYIKPWTKFKFNIVK